MATPDPSEPGRAEDCTLEEAFGRVESLVGSRRFFTELSRQGWASEGESGDASSVTATPGEAVAQAAAAARSGERALAIVSESELLSALAALEQAVAARAPLLIHVLSDGSVQRAVPAAMALGAIVLAPWKAQDAIDLSLAARRASEDCELPVLLVSDVLMSDVAPAQSGPRSTVFTPEPDFARSFLGSARTSANAPVATSYAERAPFALASALRDLGERTGRPLSPLFRFETADADEILVATGRAVPAALSLAQARRAEGQRIGVVGLRALRPFFGAELIKSVARAKSLAVVEPYDVALSPCGRIAADVKAAFADALTWASGFPGVGRIPPIVSATFAALPSDEGGMTRAFGRVLDELASGDRAERRLLLGA